MMGRMRLCSFFLNRLYLFQSLGLDRLPWFLPPRILFWFFLFVVHLCSCLDRTAYPAEQEERRRDTRPISAYRRSRADDRTVKEREDSQTGEISFNRSQRYLRATPFPLYDALYKYCQQKVETGAKLEHAGS
jgi:hypothetical protein